VANGATKKCYAAQRYDEACTQLDQVPNLIYRKLMGNNKGEGYEENNPDGMPCRG
jgi:hypothetical protein